MKKYTEKSFKMKVKNDYMDMRDTFDADLKEIERGKLKNHPQVKTVIEQINERSNLKEIILTKVDNSKYEKSVFKKYRKEIVHSLNLDCFSRKDLLHQMVLQETNK